MEDMHKRCKKWIELQFSGKRSVLIYEIIAEAEKRYDLHEKVIMRLVAQVLNEGSSAVSR